MWMDSGSDSISALGPRLQGLYGWAKISPFSFVGYVGELGFLSWEVPFSLFFIFSYLCFEWTYVTVKSTLNAELEGLQWWLKPHMYFHKQFNQQKDGTVSGQNLIPCIAKNLWKGRFCVLPDPCK